MSQLVTETGRGNSGGESGGPPHPVAANGPEAPASPACAIHVLTKLQIRELCGRSRRPGRPGRPATKRAELPRVTA